MFREDGSAAAYRHRVSVPTGHENQTVNDIRCREQIRMKKDGPGVPQAMGKRRQADDPAAFYPVAEKSVNHTFRTEDGKRQAPGQPVTAVPFENPESFQFTAGVASGGKGVVQNSRTPADTEG